MQALQNTANLFARSFEQITKNIHYILAILALTVAAQYAAYNFLNFNSMQKLSAWNLLLAATSIYLFTNIAFNRNKNQPLAKLLRENLPRVFPAAVLFALLAQYFNSLSYYAGLAFYVLGFYWYCNFSFERQGVIKSLENAGSNIVKNYLQSVMLFVCVAALFFCQQNFIGYVAIVSNPAEALNHGLYAFVGFIPMCLIYNANQLQNNPNPQANKPGFIAVKNNNQQQD